jgi:hypothetical protein
MKRIFGIVVLSALGLSLSVWIHWILIYGPPDSRLGAALTCGMIDFSVGVILLQAFIFWAFDIGKVSK